MNGHAARRRARAVAAALALTLAVAACGSAPHGHEVVTAAPPTPGRVGVPRPEHVVVVVLENEDAGAVVGSPAAPYVNSLADTGALFTDSHAITHPSQPNYLALFSGSTHGVTDDDCPQALTGPNLAAELRSAGRSFAGYAEDLPAPGYRGCDSGDYARKHAPWADFPRPARPVGRPFRAFGPDYAHLPTVSFVIPNLCHDMHDCDTGTGDRWLRTHIGPYTRWARTHDSLLVVTFDEADDSATNRILTLFAGPMVRKGRYGQRVDHYRLLRTLEDMYRLPRAGHSAATLPITGVWTGNRR